MIFSHGSLFAQLTQSDWRICFEEVEGQGSFDKSPADHWLKPLMSQYLAWANQFTDPNVAKAEVDSASSTVNQCLAKRRLAQLGPVDQTRSTTLPKCEAERRNLRTQESRCNPWLKGYCEDILPNATNALKSCLNDVVGSHQTSSPSTIANSQTNVVNAQTVEISCLAVDVFDGDKTEYMIAFDDSDRSKIRVSGVRIPGYSAGRTFKLDAFGASIIKWSTFTSNHPGASFTVDRVNGTFERYQNSTERVTHTGKCGLVTEKKKF